MGREVRMVPADYQHARDERGRYIGQHGRAFADELAEWEEGKQKWSEGLMSKYGGGWEPIGEERSMTWEEWTGGPPEQGDYMPAFPPGTATHYMMFENTTEGTPISPAFATPEELAHWLADTGASTFADNTADYEWWLRVIRGGSPAVEIAPGFIAI